MASFICLEGDLYARMVNCDPSMYDPGIKSCIGFYCHSNGKGEFRPVKWDMNTPRMNCFSCHDSPPKDSMHSKATLDTCGQSCHTQTISNGYTTGYHINGKIDGTYEGLENEQCLACHESPQGAYPAIAPEFQMLSSHIGGPATNYDCAVCHMEDGGEYHQNGQVELKNHQGGQYYTLSQYNQFCLSCHDLGNSLFGPTPFSTARPIPSIRNQLMAKRAQSIESIRFCYPHNHTTGEGYTAADILNQSGPNSMFFVDISNQNMMRMRESTPDDSGSLTRYRTDITTSLMGGGGMTGISPVSVPIALDPVAGGIGSMMAPALTAAVIPTPTVTAALTPVMGVGMPAAAVPAVSPIVAATAPMMGVGSPALVRAGSPVVMANVPMMGIGSPAVVPAVSPVVMATAPMMGVGSPAVVPAVSPIVMATAPMMGGGATAMMPAVAPVVAVSTPMMGGGLASPAVMAPGGAATVMLMTGGGNDVMNMVRTGIGTMVMGPTASPVMEMLMGVSNPMMGMTIPMMTMTTPMMGLANPMIGMVNPMLGMVNPMMGMQYPMMGMVNPMMGMQNPMMGVQNPMMGMVNPMMGMQYPMMGMVNPMMGMPGPGMGNMPGMGMPGPGMGNMPGMGMPGPGMGNMPGMGMPGPGMQNMPGMGMPTPMMSMPTPMMGNMPGMGNQGGNMTPTNQTNNNTNNSQNQNQQTNEPRQTEACIACHTYENEDLLNVSVIANNFSGHFTHQNCIYCHRPHGSQFQGLLKQGINWNRNNRSCNTEACHPTYIHNPPLADTGIYYDMRPESTCNTYSCHVGSGQNGMFRYKVITSPEP